MTSTPVLRLASASPRRRELLAQIGVPHIASPLDLDENPVAGEAPRDYVLRLARAKAQTAREAARQTTIQTAGDLPVLGADTTVVVDGIILGKPADAEQHDAMLKALSGRAHEVLTAVALASATGVQCALSVSQVRLRATTADERARYWATGEPRDKAGGYAIQGLGAIFIESLAGSYSGVMGLPLFETAQLLAAAGVPCWMPGAGAWTVEM